MDRRYRYIRRLERRAHLVRSVAGLAIIGAAICATAFALGLKPDPIRASMEATAPASALLSSFAPTAAATTRRVYPFSIVPGGVASQTELVRIVRSDRVVASHYATFDVSRAYPVTVAAPRAVHVSYRKGNKVFWTAKKVMLREGETLLSDGKNEIRARCGNRVSDVAQFPVAAQEPGAELLDTAIDEDLADAEEGRRINAAMDLADAIAVGVGEQAQLSALAGATASQVVSTTVGNTAGVAPGARPWIAERPGNMTIAQVDAAGTPGAPLQADASASAGDVASAPALLVATGVGQASDAQAGPSAPAGSGIVTSAAATVQPASGSALTQREQAAMPQRETAMPFAQTTAGEENSKPTELPEPGTGWLVALALGSLLVMRNRR